MHAVRFVPSDSTCKAYLLAIFPDHQTAMGYRPAHMDGRAFSDDEMRRFIRVDPWVSLPPEPTDAPGMILEEVRRLVEKHLAWVDVDRVQKFPAEALAMGWIAMTLNTVLEELDPKSDTEGEDGT